MRKRLYILAQVGLVQPYKFHCLLEVLFRLEATNDLLHLQAKGLKRRFLSACYGTLNLKQLWHYEGQLMRQSDNKMAQLVDKLKSNYGYKTRLVCMLLNGHKKTVYS